MRNRPLFYLGHPAHYHLFKELINDLLLHGVGVKVVIKKKDVLEDLVKEEGWGYTVLAGNPKSHQVVIRLFNVYRLFSIFLISLFTRRSDLLGSAAELAIVGRILGCRSFLFFEDDLSEVPLFAKIAGPYSSLLICPESCSSGKWSFKTLKYPSYHELAYLHPNHFVPNIDRLPSAIDRERPFFILRFSDLLAYHDVGKTGITDALAHQLVKILESRGQVYITSERPLVSSLEKYRLRVDPKDIHHVLFFADLFIGDSQTMTAESAVLGTMSFRYNDFVGRLGYLEELEHRFSLTKGIKPGFEGDLITVVNDYLEKPESKESLQIKREKLLSEMVDLNKFMIWFYNNLPDSIETWRKGQVAFEDFLTVRGAGPSHHGAPV